MSVKDREKWDRRYEASDSAGESFPSPALAWLAMLPDPTPGAVALDLACGLGRNALELVRLGYRVVAADISILALRIVARKRRDGESLHVAQTDVDAWSFAPARFDLVVQTNFLNRRALECVRGSVKPGGLLLVDTFAGVLEAGASGPRSAEHRLRDGELARTFRDWEILRIEEGSSSEFRATVLARRPQEPIRSVDIRKSLG